MGKWYEDFFKKGDDGSSGKMGYLIILLVLGVILFLFTNKNITEHKKVDIAPAVDTVQTEKTLSYEESLEKRLEESFSQIAGVGEVDVTLTLASSKEIILNKDEVRDESSLTEEDSNGGNRNSKESSYSDTTITLSGSDGSQDPIVLKENMPMVQGIIILATQGDKPTVQESLTRAAQILLDVPAHKVFVSKKNE